MSQLLSWWEIVFGINSIVDVSIGEHLENLSCLWEANSQVPLGPVLVRQMQYLHWAGSWDLALDPNATIQAVVQYCLFITEADPAHWPIQTERDRGGDLKQPKTLLWVAGAGNYHRIIGKITDA